MDVVFLGVNDVGMRIYEWLCDRDTVDVVALLTEPAQLDLVREKQPDVVVSVGFDYLVPSEVLKVPSDGALNLHPSLLPHNRGKSPNVWPIVDGTPAGATLHYMDPEFDTGDIVAQTEIETDFADTGKDLHRRLETAQYDLFVETWPAVEAGDIDSHPQKPNAGNYHSTDDFLELCELDPGQELQVKTLLDRLRALTFPPPSTTRQSKSMVVPTTWTSKSDPKRTQKAKPVMVSCRRTNHSRRPTLCHRSLRSPIPLSARVSRRRTWGAIRSTVRRAGEHRRCPR